jgi:Family of unknown function (DUF6069)
MSSTSFDHTASNARYTVLRVGAGIALVAIVANSVVWAVARLAGAELEVTANGSTQDIGLPTVVATTLVPLALATAALWVIRRKPSAWRVLAWVGLAIGVLTIATPIAAEATAGTTTALVSMHLITGTAWFAGVFRALGRG